MSHSDERPVDDPPEAQWIDRYVMELGRLLPDMTSDEAQDLAWDTWRTCRGDRSPEDAAEDTLVELMNFGLIHEPPPGYAPYLVNIFVDTSKQ